jgi:hypothetical protein
MMKVWRRFLHRFSLQYAIACHVKMERSLGKDFPKTFSSQVDYSKKRPHVPGCFALAAASIDY